MPFVVILIGVIVGFITYGSNMTAYKKAGAGQTYRIESSTNVRFTRQLDNRGMTRSRVDHGFYSGSVSAAGRSEAYPMPQSIKNTIEQAKDNAQHSVSTGHNKPSDMNGHPGSAQPRPPRPNAGARPNGANRPPHRPGAPGPMNRRDK